MYLEGTVLSIMGTRSGYYRLKDTVKLKQLAKAAQVVIRSLESYYKNYTHDEVIPDTFRVHLCDMQKQKITAAEMPLYDTYINKFSHTVDTATQDGLIHQLKELDMSAALTEMLVEYEAGEEVSVFTSCKEMIADYTRELRQDNSNIEVTDSIESILEDLESGTKFQWTNKALREAMPDMRTGDQVIFAARPGTGKTSFIIYEVARMAPFLPEGRPIVYFCNEGKGQKIRLSKYRSLTGCTTAELAQIGGDACRRLVEDAGCGEANFKVYNVHSKSVYDLEEILQDVNPCIVIWDMLDNVKGFNKETRTDLRLEELYKWARDCAVLYDFLSLPTSQMSMDAEGEPFPSQEMLKDSKTGKQGACDALIMMGKDNNPAKHASRYLSIAKAWKGSPKEGCDPTARCEIKFDGARCAFSGPLGSMMPTPN